MKKIITCFTGILLAISMLAFTVSAADFSDIQSSDFSDSIRLLHNIGIVDGYDDGSFRPDNTVTRAEFTAFVIRALGAANMAEVMPKNHSFADVDDNEWYAGIVNAAYAMGLIDGLSSTEFGPEENVTLYQAAKIVLSSLGYKVVADVYGGYPSGYLRVGKDAGLFKLLSLNDRELTRGETAAMIRNALFVDLIDSLDGTKTTDNLLTNYLDFDVIEGTVNQTYGGNASSYDYGVGSDQIVVDGKMYRLLMQDAEQFLGERVECYVRNENGRDVIYYIERLRETKSLYVAADDILPSTNIGRFVYSDNDKQRTIDLKADFYVIYNGKKATDNDIQNGALTPVSGGVLFKDADNDGKYDYAVVTEYKNIVVRGVNDNKIYDQYGNTLHILDNAAVKVKNKDGYITLGDVKAGDILSVAESKDGSVVSAVVSDESVSGTVSAESDDNGKKKYTIVTEDGESAEYELAQNYADAMSGSRADVYKISLRDVVTAYLDIEGKIACCIAGEEHGDVNYGFVTDLAWSTNLDGDKCQLKILTPDNKLAELSTASSGKVKLSRNEGSGYVNKKVKTEELVNILLDGRDSMGEKNRVLITYGLNGDGEIDEVNLADTNGGNTSYLSKDVPYSNMLYTNGQFGLSYRLTPNTVVFDIPNNGAHQDQVSAGMYLDYFTNGNYYNVTLYDVHEGTVGAVVLSRNVERYTSASSGYKERLDKANSSVMMVNKVSRVLDDNEDDYTAVTGFVDGEEITVRVADTLQGNSDAKNNLKAGTVIQYVLNESETDKAETSDEPVKIVMYKLLMDCSNKTKFVKSNYLDRITPNSAILFGYGTVARTTDTSFRLDVDANELKTFTFANGTAVYSCNTSSRKFEKMNPADVAEGDGVFIRQRYGSLREVVIIEE